MALRYGRRDRQHAARHAGRARSMRTRSPSAARRDPSWRWAQCSGGRTHSGLILPIMQLKLTMLKFAALRKQTTTGAATTSAWPTGDWRLEKGDRRVTFGSPPPRGSMPCPFLVDGNAGAEARWRKRRRCACHDVRGAGRGCPALAGACTPRVCGARSACSSRLHDTVDWPIAFLGAIYAGVGPVAVEHAADGRRLRVHARAQPRAVLLVSAPLLPTLTQALARRPRGAAVIVSRPAARPAGALAFDTWIAGADARIARADRRRRHRVLALLVGLDRPSEGTVHTHANLYWTAGTLRAERARLARGRRRVLRGEALLRLRPRQRADVSAGGRRHVGADGRAADAGGGVQAARRAQA